MCVVQVVMFSGNRFDKL